LLILLADQQIANYLGMQHCIEMLRTYVHLLRAAQLVGLPSVALKPCQDLLGGSWQNSGGTGGSLVWLSACQANLHTQILHLQAAMNQTHVSSGRWYTRRQALASTRPWHPSMHESHLTGILGLLLDTTLMAAIGMPSQGHLLQPAPASCIPSTGSKKSWEITHKAARTCSQQNLFMLFFYWLAGSGPTHILLNRTCPQTSMTLLQ
jgi:hypothetical protein